MAFQILEHCTTEKNIYIGGIHGNGFVLAQRLKEIIDHFGGPEITVFEISMNKEEPWTSPIVISIPESQLKNGYIVLVDDVINSGKTMQYARCPAREAGEYFIRGSVAYDVACFVEHLGVDLQSACNEVIQKRLLDLGGDGGLIAINREGMVSFSFNTEGMYRGYRKSDGTSYTAIYRD